jgi:hypothetical protein
MSNILFKQQILAVDPIEQIEFGIAQGNAVSGEELLRTIEQCETRPLDARLRDVIRKFSVSAVKRRGRPSNCTGREDFALAKLDARYPALLRKHEQETRRVRRLAAAENDVPSRIEQTPSELAYTEILGKMQPDFPNIDWLALRNKHSAWKNGHYHPSENHVDSDDFNAEIKRQFPGPQDS